MFLNLLRKASFVALLILCAQVECELSLFILLSIPALNLRTFGQLLLEF